MFKNILCILLCLCTCLVLSGCDSFFAADTAELLSPPTLSGEIYPIAQAIKESVKGDYTFFYPARGDYRSAVVQIDIDSDGTLETFAFYSMLESETVTMNLNFIRLVDGNWESLSQQKIVAGGVDMVDFCDLDNDGKKEILVGWQIYGTSEMQLAVYSMTENSISQRMLQRYTHFTTCDLNEDSKKEILIINSNPTESIYTAAVYVISSDGVTELSFCELDSTSKTFNEPVVSTLSSGKPAVYIDEIKGVGAVTEVLFMEKGVLVNPLFKEDSRETSDTIRSASFPCADINGDGIIEIPVQKNVPSVTRSALNEKLYLTEWCSFNGERLTVQQTTMINLDDNYYYTIPAKWSGKIAVLKDTDHHIREIYQYNPDEILVGESLIFFKTVSLTEWEVSDYAKDGAQIIETKDNTVFFCRISHTAKKEGVTLETVKNAFEIFETE